MRRATILLALALAISGCCESPDTMADNDGGPANSDASADAVSDDAGFGGDPLYSSCVASPRDAVWCPVNDVPYLCAMPVANPMYGCGPATDSNPPLVAPVGLICCP